MDFIKLLKDPRALGTLLVLGAVIGGLWIRNLQAENSLLQVMLEQAREEYRRDQKEHSYDLKRRSDRLDYCRRDLAFARKWTLAALEEIEHEGRDSGETPCWKNATLQDLISDGRSAARTWVFEESAPSLAPPETGSD